MENYQCESCSKSFSRKFNLDRHVHLTHGNQKVVERCSFCSLTFTSCEELLSHIRRDHKPSKTFVVFESAFRKTIVTYKYTFDDNITDLLSAQKLIEGKLRNLILYESSKKNVIKVGLVVFCEMVMYDISGEKITTAVIPFRAKNFLSNAQVPRNINTNIKKSFRQHFHRMEELVNNGSNWVFNRAIQFFVEISPLRAMF